MSKNILGFYIKNRKEFFYLETGENYVSNQIDRVRKTLVQREILSTKVGPNSQETPHEIISLSEAQEKDLKISPIFLSKNIKELYEQKNKTKNTFG